MNDQIFEQIKRVNEYGKEYRHARELSKALEYSDFSNFSKVVQKAELACKNSGQATTNHFSAFTEKVKIGSGASRALKSRKLSRYACYLIIQNADPSKEIVALGQSYFALQTRQQELSAQYLEDQKRLELRDEVTKHNKKLFSTARGAGVHDYATFYDSGYQGLYGLKKKEWWLWLNRIITLFLVMIALIFFRSNNLSDAFDAVKEIFSCSSQTLFISTKDQLFHMVTALIILFVTEYIIEYKKIQVSDKNYLFVYSVTSICLLTLILCQGVFDGSQFIYFQF